MSTTPTLPCPICRKTAALGDPDFPFCSERCRITDLGNWATERYVLSAPLDEEDLLEMEDAQRPLEN